MVSVDTSDPEAPDSAGDAVLQNYLSNAIFTLPKLQKLKAFKKLNFSC